MKREQKNLTSSMLFQDKKKKLLITKISQSRILVLLNVYAMPHYKILTDHKFVHHRKYISSENVLSLNSIQEMVHVSAKVNLFSVYGYIVTVSI